MKVSLSARRAWIEIREGAKISSRKAVALRKESVDRNAHIVFRLKHAHMSLSARRAWIEIGAGLVYV